MTTRSGLQEQMPGRFEEGAPVAKGYSAEAGIGTRSAADGYGRLGAEKAPFDILLLVRRFAAYRFETGTPAFLTLLRRGVASPDLDGLSATDDLLSAFDVDEMSAGRHCQLRCPVLPGAAGASTRGVVGRNGA